MINLQDEDSIINSTDIPAIIMINLQDEYSIINIIDIPAICRSISIRWTFNYEYYSLKHPLKLPY